MLQLPQWTISLKKKTETIKLAEYDFDSDHTGYYDNPLLNGKDKDVVSLLLGYTTWNCCVEKTPSKIELISPFE